MYNWSTLLHTWSWYNSVNQLYPNNYFLKKWKYKKCLKDPSCSLMKPLHLFTLHCFSQGSAGMTGLWWMGQRRSRLGNGIEDLLLPVWVPRELHLFAENHSGKTLSGVYLLRELLSLQNKTRRKAGGRVMSGETRYGQQHRDQALFLARDVHACLTQVHTNPSKSFHISLHHSRIFALKATHSLSAGVWKPQRYH